MCVPYDDPATRKSPGFPAKHVRKYYRCTAAVRPDPHVRAPRQNGDVVDRYLHGWHVSVRRGFCAVTTRELASFEERTEKRNTTYHSIRTRRPCCARTTLRSMLFFFFYFAAPRDDVRPCRRDSRLPSRWSRVGHSVANGRVTRARRVSAFRDKGPRGAHGGRRVSTFDLSDVSRHFRTVVTG